MVLNRLNVLLAHQVTSRFFLVCQHVVLVNLDPSKDRQERQVALLVLLVTLLM